MIVFSSEVGIYERKQESKKTRKQELDQESDQETRKQELDQEKKKKKLFFLNHFLGRNLVFLFITSLFSFMNSDLWWRRYDGTLAYFQYFQFECILQESVAELSVPAFSYL